MANAEYVKTIYNEYSLDLYRYGYSVLRNHEIAEDLVAETFERLLKLKEINHKTIKSWLFTVAHNLMMDKFKATRQLVDVGDENLIAFPDEDSIAPEADAISNEQIEIVKAELDRLSPEQKEIIILKTWEDYKFHEIAKILSTSENTIKSHYYRALKILKANIEKQYGKQYALAFLPVLVMALANSKNTITNLLSKKIMTDLVTNTAAGGPTTIAATTLPMKALVAGTLATIVAAATIAGGVYIYDESKNDTVDTKVVASQPLVDKTLEDESDAQLPSEKANIVYDYDNQELGLRLQLPDELKQVNDYPFKHIIAYEYIGPHSITHKEKRTDAQNDRMTVVIADTLPNENGYSWIKIDGGGVLVDGQTADIFEFSGTAEFKGIAYVLTHRGKKIVVITEAQRYFVQPGDGPDVGDSAQLADQEKFEYERKMKAVIDSIDLY